MRTQLLLMKKLNFASRMKTGKKDRKGQNRLLQDAHGVRSTKEDVDVLLWRRA
jgi:hypothetical protein